MSRAAAVWRLLPEASPALRALLDPRRGTLLPPIRSEIFGPQRFAQHGRSLGETHRAARATSRTTAFHPRLHDNIDALREAHHFIGLQAATGYDVSPAAEWLLDNFHLIEAQLKAIHEGLPRSYFRRLPVLIDEPLAGLPRVYGVAWAFVAHTDGAFDEDLLLHFLGAYQETRELTLSEMWALPTSLRVVLIDDLRRLAERVAANKAAREVANLCCDHIDRWRLADLDALRELLRQRGVERVLLTQMALRLRDDQGSDRDACRDWLRAALPDLAGAQAQQGVDQTADNLSVSNAVTSLRAVGDADWPDIVARTSALMRLMLTSPVFEAEHAVTRDQTLHGIEALARRADRSEVWVARILVSLMGTGPCSAATAVDVPSHWLEGRGRPVLTRALGLNEGLAQTARRLGRRLVLPAYLGALAAGSAASVAWLLGRAGSGLPPAWGLAGQPAASALAWGVAGQPAASVLAWGVAGQQAASALAWGLVLLLLLLPASEAVVALINRLISESARPRPLPRLALASGIPPAHRVMVVMPAMLTHPAAIRVLAHRLLLHHLANPEDHVQFALLTDSTDADRAELPTDAALLAEAQACIDDLNARYPARVGRSADGQDAPRFLLLHRTRRFSTSEQRWIGWERKRGKLAQLVAALATDDAQAFLDRGEASRIAAGTRYILTLDSDTELPPGRLHDLVGVAAHPHNQPRLAPDGRSVLSGYGILQPRIVTPLPARRELTGFHRLFAGQCGVDPYSAATSEVYQDLFGEGSFSGKGLLNVAAMHAVLDGRLPEGLVLSHDLLEGALARCASVSDITLIEEAPHHADVAAARMHRWTRGDWQLLPFLLQPRRYPMRAVNRWKMLDNLRRSLVAPGSLAALLLALAGVGVAPGWVLGLVLAAFTAGPLLGALAGFVPGRMHLARRRFYAQGLADLGRALGGGLWHLAQLLQHALMAVDALTRALYRLRVSRRYLLQWMTAADAQAAAPTGLRALLHRHRTEPALAAVLFGCLVLADTPWPVFSLALCALWAGSPLWTWWISRPPDPRPEVRLSAADRDALTGIARDTWGLFERCVGADDRHLPPDNLQVLPQDMVAHRTSPTNIGLYLLSAACAREFGWIDTPQLLARLEATLATLLTLQRHRGHFFNWYDTQSGPPLLPMYVSTVDSGNLSGHLLAVAEACLERARAGPRDPQRANPHPAGDPVAQPADALADAGTDAATGLRLLALAAAFQQLAWQADFSFLYHRKRHLFHIGYRVAEQQLDASYYDLLASESRLTSLLAIAKGDVPVRHWAALGRPFYAVGVAAGLRSWSGSMFEYLMPSLVLAEPPGSVLCEAGHAALREQIAFARAQGVPWGISESAYAGRDHTLAYQYAPQGVPRLALRRTPLDELVIAPYATVLAAPISPHLALANLRRLQAMKARGRYGFIEALDFSPSRRVGTEAFTPVATFMAHHQGMSIVALANLLRGGVAQRWGMANPHIEAVGSLLHERAPREVSLLHEPPAGPPPGAAQRLSPGLLREILPAATALAPTHLLSNGRYRVALRPNGAGWSRWGTLGITRWRDDALRDALGSFFYLRQDERSAPVSITQHPAPDPAAHYQSTFHADRVCFDATGPHWQAHCTVWVSPEDDIEFRQVELRNLGDAVLDIELISAFEVTLADPRADESHPAFTNLFVSAQWLAEQQALVFERTPRLPSEVRLQAAHFLAKSDPQVQGLRIQTDRQRWLGRSRAASQPLASLDEPPTAAVPVSPGADDAAPSGARAADATNGVPLVTGLDPVCVLAVRLRIAAGGKARLTFATAASDHGGTLRAVIDKYRQPSHVERASLMSATLMGIRLRTQRLTAETFAAIQTVTTALVMSLTRPALGLARAEACDRRTLWRHGLSGDQPIVLVSAGQAQGLSLLRALAQALKLWDWGGVACDLVVVNTEPASYQPALQRELTALRERHEAERAAPPGGALTRLHVLRSEELDTELMTTLHRLARLDLQADGRPLTHHVQAWSELHELAFEERHALSTAAVAVAATPPMSVPVPQGQFADASGKFRFDVHAGLRPARPWVNVIANPEFGTQLSDSGGGCTWAVNSRLNQLTAWSNDPVADPPSEWLLLQDTRSGEVWSATPSAWAAGSVVYRVAHGQGYSVIRHRRGDLEVSVAWCVDAETAVKQVRVRLVNRGHRSQHLRLIGIAEWMMGAQRSDRNTVQTALHRQRLPDRPAPSPTDPAEPDAPDRARRADTPRGRKLNTLLCTQTERSAGFGGGTAFLALAGSDDDTEDWTCDRRECFDARGQMVVPDHFGQRSGGGLDPCAALACRLHLGAGESAERVFLLGYAADADAARTLATRAAVTSAMARLARARAGWDTLLGASTVLTPDPLFDVMVNRWLLYQTVSSRLWAKAGFYQAGGATGFRDQLQDTLALAWAAPQMLRAQIVLCASRQYPAGDVQHWWHRPGGAGVRTHFSDDLLWLPWACAHHLRCTGDATLLDQAVPFIEGAEIPAGAEDVYETPTVSAFSATVFEHAARAIDRSLRVGRHGLPLMGSGDWNDGMNRVGIEGRGESVWLGWFLCRLVADFAPLARARGEAERASTWEAAAAGWKAALLGPAWDGQWFVRAFFDDGGPLGSHVNQEARIDLIAQAWAVLSQVAPVGMQHLAMASVQTQLMDARAGLIRLLDPPLASAQPSAGYIQAYPPGVRENGGQYAHAAVWALMAQAELARSQSPAGTPSEAGDLAYRSFTWLSPAHRSTNPAHRSAYGLEPYVMAGDIYSQPPYVGRGGWSWYTGAAAWMHRAAHESILGLHWDASQLSFQPGLPSHWQRAELSLRRDGQTMRFVLLRGTSLAGVQAAEPALTQILWPGQRLNWRALPAQSEFLVPLLDKRER